MSILDSLSLAGMAVVITVLVYVSGAASLDRTPMAARAAGDAVELAESAEALERPLEWPTPGASMDAVARNR